MLGSLRHAVRMRLHPDQRLDYAEHQVRILTEAVRALEDDLHKAERDLAWKDTAIHRLLAHLLEHDRGCGAWPSGFMSEPGQHRLTR
jgi:chromosome segregation ATPase